MKGTKPAYDILEFWFAPESRPFWYVAQDAFDATIRAKFEQDALDLASALQTGKSHKWEETPETHLALIIAMDQFPRNMFRGTIAAYGWDHLALALAKRLVENGGDLKLDMERRIFAYLPFMHSETLADQDRCVALIESRLNDADNLHHANEHRKLIARFGRFPHRNYVLDRASTPEEDIFLNEGGYRP